LAYSAYERLETSGSNLMKLFHEKCQDVGVKTACVQVKQ